MKQKDPRQHRENVILAALSVLILLLLLGIFLLRKHERALYSPAPERDEAKDISLSLRELSREWESFMQLYNALKASEGGTEASDAEVTEDGSAAPGQTEETWPTETVPEATAAGSSSEENPPETEATEPERTEGEQSSFVGPRESSEQTTAKDPSPSAAKSTAAATERATQREPRQTFPSVAPVYTKPDSSASVPVPPTRTTAAETLRPTRTTEAAPSPVGLWQLELDMAPAQREAISDKFRLSHYPDREIPLRLQLSLSSDGWLELIFTEEDEAAFRRSLESYYADAESIFRREQVNPLAVTAFKALSKYQQNLYSLISSKTLSQIGCSYRVTPQQILGGSNGSGYDLILNYRQPNGDALQLTSITSSRGSYQELLSMLTNSCGFRFPLNFTRVR